jgi:hypothetical protein
MARSTAPSQHPELELDNADDAPDVMPSSADNHLLTGKKLAIAFTAMLLALLRMFTEPHFRARD